MGNFKWLHLSDLHFRMCEGFDMGLILEQLETVLKKETENEKFKFIFLTGDVADCFDYSMVESRVKKLLLESKILEDDGSVFWVCGNHDIPRKKKHRDREIADIRDKSIKDVVFENEFTDDESRGILLNAFNMYYRERERLFGTQKFDDYPHQVIHTDDAEIVLLNTCITSCDDEDEHKLYLCEQKLIDLFNEIEQGKPVFVVGHHSLNYLVDTDKARLLSLFSENNVSVYLCGHAHQLGVQPLSESILEIVSGGFKMDGYAVVSFIIGKFDEESSEYELVPYAYRSGSKRWGKDYCAVMGMKEDKKYQISISDKGSRGELSDIIIRSERLFQNKTNIDKLDVRIFNQIGEEILQKYVKMLLNTQDIENMDFEALCEVAVQNGNKKINYPSLRIKKTIKDIWRFRDNFIRILRELGKNDNTFPVIKDMLFDFNDFFERVNRFDVTENTYVLVADAIHDINNDLNP